MGSLPTQFALAVLFKPPDEQSITAEIGSISMSLCSPPSVTINQCPDNFFFCDNKMNCVPKEAICDFNDDCGDGSDEQDCGKSVISLDI